MVLSRAIQEEIPVQIAVPVDDEPGIGDPAQGLMASRIKSLTAHMEKVIGRRQNMGWNTRNIATPTPGPDLRR